MLAYKLVYAFDCSTQHKHDKHAAPIKGEMTRLIPRRQLTAVSCLVDWSDTRIVAQAP